MSKYTDAIAKRYPCQDYYLSYGNGEQLGFSSRPCECCGSRLAGDRFDAYVISLDNGRPVEAQAIDVCLDCIIWIANGEEPES